MRYRLVVTQKKQKRTLQFDDGDQQMKKWQVAMVICVAVVGSGCTTVTLDQLKTQAELYTMQTEFMVAQRNFNTAVYNDLQRQRTLNSGYVAAIQQLQGTVFPETPEVVLEEQEVNK